MLVKNADDQTAALAALEKDATLPGLAGKHATVELRNRRAGIRGERDAAYLIDFDFAQSPNWAVIHDLRVEHRGRVAQIDHLLINRWMQVYVLETKHFHAGVKINEDGEFLRWNDFAKRYEGMPSPLEQNQRHIRVLDDVFGTIDLPTRAGFRITPEFIPLILVSPAARIDRPKRFDSSRVVKADTLKTKIWKDIDSENSVLGILKTVAKIVSAETVLQVAKALAAKHRSLTQAPQRLSEPRQHLSPAVTKEPALATPHRQEQSTGPSAPASTTAPTCRACGQSAGQILSGKFGYYLKCAECAANTGIRFTCLPNHEPRLRKDGSRFFRDCAACGTSMLFFENTVKNP